jgi:hypothetical protein
MLGESESESLHCLTAKVGAKSTGAQILCLMVVILNCSAFKAVAIYLVPIYLAGSRCPHFRL